MPGRGRLAHMCQSPHALVWLCLLSVSAKASIAGVALPLLRVPAPAPAPARDQPGMQQALLGNWGTREGAHTLQSSLHAAQSAPSPRIPGADTADSLQASPTFLACAYNAHPPAGSPAKLLCAYTFHAPGGSSDLLATLRRLHAARCRPALSALLACPPALQHSAPSALTMEPPRQTCPPGAGGSAPAANACTHVVAVLHSIAPQLPLAPAPHKLPAAAVADKRAVHFCACQEVEQPLQQRSPELQTTALRGQKALHTPPFNPARLEARPGARFSEHVAGDLPAESDSDGAVLRAAQSWRAAVDVAKDKLRGHVMLRGEYQHERGPMQAGMPPPHTAAGGQSAPHQQTSSPGFILALCLGALLGLAFVGVLCVSHRCCQSPPDGRRAAGAAEAEASGIERQGPAHKAGGGHADPTASRSTTVQAPTSLPLSHSALALEDGGKGVHSTHRSGTMPHPGQLHSGKQTSTSVHGLEPSNRDAATSCVGSHDVPNSSSSVATRALVAAHTGPHSGLSALGRAASAANRPGRAASAPDCRLPRLEQEHLEALVDARSRGQFPGVDGGGPTSPVVITLESAAGSVTAFRTPPRDPTAAQPSQTTTPSSAKASLSPMQVTLLDDSAAGTPHGSVGHCVSPQAYSDLEQASARTEAASGGEVGGSSATRPSLAASVLVRARTNPVQGRRSLAPSRDPAPSPLSTGAPGRGVQVPKLQLDTYLMPFSRSRSTSMHIPAHQGGGGTGTLQETDLDGRGVEVQVEVPLGPGPVPGEPGRARFHSESDVGPEQEAELVARGVMRDYGARFGEQGIKVPHLGPPARRTRKRSPSAGQNFLHKLGLSPTSKASSRESTVSGPRADKAPLRASRSPSISRSRRGLVPMAGVMGGGAHTQLAELHVSTVTRSLDQTLVSPMAPGTVGGSRGGTDPPPTMLQQRSTATSGGSQYESPCQVDHSSGHSGAFSLTEPPKPTRMQEAPAAPPRAKEPRRQRLSASEGNLLQAQAEAAAQEAAAGAGR